VTRFTRIFVGFMISTMLLLKLIVNPMGRILVRRQSFIKYLKIPCHPTCIRLNRWPGWKLAQIVVTFMINPFKNSSESREKFCRELISLFICPAHFYHTWHFYFSEVSPGSAEPIYHIHKECPLTNSCKSHKFMMNSLTNSCYSCVMNSVANSYHFFEGSAGTHMTNWILARTRVRHTLQHTATHHNSLQVSVTHSCHSCDVHMNSCQTYAKQDQW